MNAQDELAVGDSVVLKKVREPAPVWTIHELHLPTIEGEKLLVSLRPKDKPNDKDYEGWPMCTYHTTEASKVRKV